MMSSFALNSKLILMSPGINRRHKTERPDGSERGKKNNFLFLLNFC